jgi:hypothetical protein
MKFQFNRFSAALPGAVLCILAGCGGGNDNGGSTTAPPVVTPATTTNVSITVIDGAVQNAVVCLDKNANGKCDADETQGKTDATGAVTLAVPNADVGKYPLLALVGTDAVDADHGPVTVAYALSAPADQTGVVSPLTTLVQQTIATTGASTSVAAASVQQATGIGVSLFQDFTKTAAPTDGSVSAAVVARMLVVTAQQQSTAIAGTVGTPAADGTTITQADLDKAIQKKLLELIPSLVAALNDPSVTAASTPAAKDAALAAVAGALVTSAGLTPAAVPTVVAIDTQTSSAPSTTTTTPAAGFSLRALNFTGAQNYSYRAYSSTLSQATPDASNNTRYVDRRVSSAAGTLATWGSGNSPARGADLHWNGSAWANCPLNFENTSSVRDAQGNNTYDYCGGAETGKSNLASFDVAGKTMASVYAQVRAAGYTNLNIADATVLGGATFPAGALLQYVASTPLTEAISYYPGGSGSPAGTGSVASQYSAAVAAGGNAASQAAGTGCNAAETNTQGMASTTLEGLIAVSKGTPCVYNQGSFTYGGTTYTSDTPNEWWGNSTVSIGTIGTAPFGSGSTTSYYSTNTNLRAAFTGPGTNPVTYYACKQRFTDGSKRNCIPIGNGSYAITTLGDARVLTLNNPPAQVAALSYSRVLVERGGLVYLGYQNRPTVANNARLNTVGATALMTQLGIAPVDPNATIAYSLGSYQGTWDARNSSAPFSTSNQLTIVINPNGTNVCQDFTGTSLACGLNLDPPTGAFSIGDGSGGVLIAGTLDVATGAVTGTNLTGGRR